MKKQITPYLIVIFALLSLVFLGFIYFTLKPNFTLINTNTSQEVLFKSNPLISVLGEIHSPVPIFSLDPHKGNPKAKVTVVVFGNFKEQLLKTVIEELEKNFSDNILLIWKDLVAEDDTLGFNQAKAAHCASLQDKFWPFVLALFDEPDYNIVAQNLGIKNSNFVDCLSNDDFEALITESYFYANSLNLISHPWFYINQEIITDYTNLEKLKQTIQNELAK